MHKLSRRDLLKAMPLAAVAAALGIEQSQLSRNRGRVRRGLHEQDVDILTIGHKATALTPTAAMAAFAAWMAYQPERDYYRIVRRDSGAVAVYDRATGDRWWANKNTDEMVDLEEITPATTSWQAASAALINAAGTASSAA